MNVIWYTISIKIRRHGNIRKVTRFNVQLYDKEVENDKGNEEKNEARVQFEEQGFGDNIEDKDVEVVDKRVTRSMTDAKREEMRKEEISTFWMQVENSECFDEMTIYTVEVPVREHKKPEVIEAKQKEIENLEKYGVFEEVEDEGQETVGSRWVITKKEKADGQKKNYKGRLVAKGFQEKEAPQSDSPTMLRESMKMFFSVAANEDFKLRKIDIRAAFLQAKQLDREVFLQPPKDIKRDGYIWKLKKPLYGLNDASWKFWLRVKKIFKEIGLRRLDGDEAVY